MMRKMSWAAKLSLVVAAVLACAAPAASAQLQFASKHYQITTDLPREMARKTARYMDAVHEAYTRRFSGFEPRRRAGGKRSLHVYARERSYLQYLRRHEINATGSDGMFFVTEEASGLAAFLGEKGMSRMLHTLRHEGFHQFAWARIGPNLPVWANEGTAEYFGEAVMVRGSLRTGQVPPRRLARLRSAIRAGKHIPFDTMLSMPNEQWKRKVRQDRGRVQYDQAWSMVHFLVHGSQRYQDAFEQYLKLIARGRDPQQAYDEAFGAGSEKAFERAWGRFVLNRLKPNPVTTAAQRLQFLAHGLRFLREKGRPARSLRDLRRKLEAIHFRITSPLGHGRTLELSAANGENFRPPPPPGGGNSRFKMVRSPDDELPPRIRTVGLPLTVELRWTRRPDGQIVSRIVYR